MSIVQAAAGAELAIFNSGSIRIDDQVPAGPITQYDVIRILPFEGKVLLVEMPGELLQRVLDQGEANRGTGGFLQTAQVSRAADNHGWLIHGQPLQSQQSYRVAINDFLVSGHEQGIRSAPIAINNSNLDRGWPHGFSRGSRSGSDRRYA